MLLISPIMKILLSILILLLGFNVSAQDPCYSVKDFMTQTELENSSITKNFVGGWNMFGYTCSQEIDVVDAFSSIIDKVLIVKSNNGSVYMPEFGFNGIGFLEGGEGYQIKMSNTEYGFSFCEHITWPNLEGCTDCEAANFNQWANVDDGSCNYDSDGDGIPDSEEVVGCQDSLACDYNISATDSGECFYAQDGYDCEGNLLIYVGAEAESGIVFYYDSIGDFGLVVASEDIGSYEWGCYGLSVNGSDLTALGTGYQNTLNIVAGCSETPIAASEALAYESEGFDDWYLPSLNELYEIYNTIGYGGIEGNLGGLALNGDNYWSSTEGSSHGAGGVGLDVGTGYFDYPKFATYIVRPIRAFGNWTMGCIDSLACNYNPEANMADGSCEYPEQGYDCVGNITAQIGDIIEGGYLFYLNETNTGGLVAALEDIGAYEWGCFNDNVQGADGTEIGTGYQNTLDIFNQDCVDGNGGVTAAPAAFEYVSDNYGNWHLPSKNELIEMYNSIGQGSSNDNIGGFADTWYWSSSEINNSTAWYISFGNFLISTGGKTHNDLVRPIRAFGNWIEGCMSENACNYNPEANMADNSCVFPEQGYDCGGNINVQVGDEAFGGIVFYIDDSGQRGLVAAIEDLDNLYTWGCQGVNILTDLSLGYGLDNTLKIIDNCSESPIAASEVLDIEIGGFADWFLPSQDELILMWASIGQGSSLDNFGGFSANFYYSSSQKTNMAAYGKYFPTGEEYELFKNSGAKIRPVRAFGNWIEGCIDETACNYNSQVNLPNSTLCEYSQLGYDCDGNITEYVVGMQAEGGIVFYVDETGEHGLVAAVEDLFEGAIDPYDYDYNGYEWGCYETQVNGADAIQLGTGYQNTLDIINQGCTSESGGIIAAEIAVLYESEGYSDWYLPSKEELSEMYYSIGNGSSQGNIGGFETTNGYYYWSSSEQSANSTWNVSFYDGGIATNGKFATFRIRVIRSF